MTQILNISSETSAFIQNTLHYCAHCGEPIAGDGIDLPGGDVACGADCASLLGYEQCHNCHVWFDADEARSDPDDNPLCLDCFDEHYEVCADCGDTIPLEDAYWLERREKTICPDCRERHYTRCHDCGDLTPNEYSYFVEGRDYHVCLTCRDNNYSYCDGCGHLVHHDQMSGRYCDDCEAEDTDDRIHDYCYKPVYNFLQTEDDSAEYKLYFGFELEIEVAESIAEACDVVEDFPYLYMKSDSSINRGFEIVSHPGTLHYWHQEEEAISGLLQQLKALGCDAEPQGLHIHISKSLMQEGHKIRFQSFFDANKTLMPKIARRSDCGYCKHKALSRWDWKNAANNPDRYQAVNWQNPRTVEVRMFRGTLKPDEFMASIEFCHAVHQFTKNQISLATIANGDSWNPFCAFIRHDSRYAGLGKYLASHGLMEDRQCA